MDSTQRENRARRFLFCERERQPDDPLVWLMDLNVVSLVRALNALDGVETLTSCGGHENPGPTQYQLGSWYVKFRVRGDEAGQRSLARLAWLINNEAIKRGRDVLLFPYARSPRARELTFVLEGHNGEAPDGLARWIARAGRRAAR